MHSDYISHNIILVNIRSGYKTAEQNQGRTT
jgi:hypothetical protein